MILGPDGMPIAGSANATVGGAARGMMRNVARRVDAICGGGKPTAKDYVHDGLIAMWDGIENVDFGRHDSGATTWKDLIGQRDLKLGEAGLFGEDHLRADGSGLAASNSSGEFLDKNSECTIEIDCSVESGKSEQAIFSTSSSGGNGRIIWWYKNGIGWGYNGNSVPYTFGDKKSFSATFDSNREVASSTMLNGVLYNPTGTSDYFTVLVGNISISSSATWLYTGNVYCIRIYDKKISDADRVNNFNVSNSRFGLTM